ncbi:unnamed protein product [Caenorhabditis angaria]|uniref:EB domain-containing protein n=1 Tax=Caenorhabditis angaria TaxID=860376 RepID=A0A9P1J2B8_9PELO|nr:unnamed protein product [Caenorhabditis angaria]
MLLFSSIFFCFSILVTFIKSEETKVGVPGTECLFGGICSGGSVCIDILCLCVDGQREWNYECVENDVYEKFEKEHQATTNVVTSSLATIGLAGHACGMGGVCRPSTKCIDGTCKCSQGYNPSFGECVRDLSVPRQLPREFKPDFKSLLRFPS